MSDLISREKAIDAVNAWLLLKSLNRTMSNAMSLQDVLRQLPSAQPERCEDCVNFGKTRLLIPQTEIIRCKDCKYMTEHYDTDGNVPYWTCSEWDSGTDYDGFCNYAERRHDGQTD